jgi:hypothetical protein
MNELTDSFEERSKGKITKILKELIEVKKVKKNKIASYLGLEKQQYSSFYKYISGGPFPKYFQKPTAKILDKLVKLLDNPYLLQRLKEPWMEEEYRGYGTPPRSSLVWIPFDLKLPIADYNGINPPLSIIQMENLKGIIANRNASKYDADGEIYIDHIGMMTYIEPGTRIAIKRINKMDWRPDRYYVIVDASGQISIWELLPGDNEKTVRYVSTSAPEGPHMILPLERIVAIFSIVDGNCIPRPKRNAIITSTNQQ